LCNGCQYGKPRGFTTHAGIDLDAKSGTEVLSPLDGEITDAAIRDNDCGGTIAINHGEVGGHETKTRYCHIRKLNVTKGQKVKKGDVIGFSGGGMEDEGRGSTSGAHLHFELYKDGKHLDPKEYVLAPNEEGRKKLWD
jgi:murein DD-endopeptidase MepM/ murein hydrolase activator NlpD